MASRAVATEVGDSKAAAAILIPFFDMANHDDVSKVTALKSVRGTDDSDIEGGLRVKFERAINQGVGGPRMVLETTRAMKAEDEVVINYDPTADNRELMLRYGFSLRANRNERLPRPPAPDPAATATLNPTVVCVALEEKGVMREDLTEEQRGRLVQAVAAACGGRGPTEDDAWELDEDDVAREAEAAAALRSAWARVLSGFPTTLGEDTATLAAAVGGSLPGVNANILCALEYRVERKQMLTSAVEAMDAYLSWLEEDEAEEEAGFVDQI